MYNVLLIQTPRMDNCGQGGVERTCVQMGMAVMDSATDAIVAWRTTCSSQMQIGTFDALDLVTLAGKQAGGQGISAADWLTD